jgi:signal peptidase I
VTDRRALGCLLEIVETVALTLILFWVIQSFVAQPFQVKQHSMENTIESDQFVLVDRLTPRFDGYHRGDIVVFTPKSNAESPQGDPFIKRVIGIGGDTVEIRDGQVLVNGTVLDEPYLYSIDGERQPTAPDGSDGRDTWTVPDGDLFVMGDHRLQSSDSRVFGPIETSSVIGRAWLRYWPLNALEILPTDSHPELASASHDPSADPSAAASTRPAAKPSARPSRSASPTPKR